MIALYGKNKNFKKYQYMFIIILTLTNPLSRPSNIISKINKTKPNHEMNIYTQKKEHNPELALYYIISNSIGPN